MTVELPSTVLAIMGSNLADALGWEKMVQKKSKYFTRFRTGFSQSYYFLE
jgi:hypothetical protein